MGSRAYLFQVQAAAAASPVHAAADDDMEVAPKVLLLELPAHGGIDEPREGSGLAPNPMRICNAEPTKCPECPKWFPSVKAMFGHLRKHPDKGYKGATRPTTASAAAAGDEKPKKAPRKGADVPAMNMAAAAATAGGKRPREETKLSTKRPATAKRARSPVVSTLSEEEEAAMILLEMASSSRTSSETETETLQQSVDPPVLAPDAVLGHQTPAVEQHVLLDHVAGHQTPGADLVVQPENAQELSAESQAPAVKQKQVMDLEITTEALMIVVNNPIVFPSVGCVAGDKMAEKLCVASHKMAEKLCVTNLEQTASAPSPSPRPEGAVVRSQPAGRIPSPASDKKHVCEICSKSFPTYQALGGHKSSHVKGKTSARQGDLAAAQAHREKSAGITIVVNGSAGSVAFQERHDAQPPPPPEPAPAPHECNECHLVFPSGQALGGHKRKHFFPEKHQAKAAPAQAPAPAPAARDFDLNELPEEGQGENNQP